MEHILATDSNQQVTVMYLVHRVMRQPTDEVPERHLTVYMSDVHE